MFRESYVETWKSIGKWQDTSESASTIRRPKMH